MAGQLLDCLRRRAPHREVRAERVAKDVKPPGRLEAGGLLRGLEEVTQKEARCRTPVVAEEHVLAAQVP